LIVLDTDMLIDILDKESRSATMSHSAASMSPWNPEFQPRLQGRVCNGDRTFFGQAIPMLCGLHTIK